MIAAVNSFLAPRPVRLKRGLRADAWGMEGGSLSWGLIIAVEGAALCNYVL